MTTSNGLAVKAAVAPIQTGNGDASNDSGGWSPIGTVCSGWVRVPESSDFDRVQMTIDGRVHDLYLAGCEGGEGALAWVPRLTLDDVLPGAVSEARSRIPAPEVQLLGVDAEHGWAYAQVPLDFRVLNLQPVSATAVATAGPTTVGITVTATPDVVTFSPGEPGAAAVSCTTAGATAGFDPAAPGECSATYRNSSAIADGGTFPASVSVNWQISYTSTFGDGALDPYAVTTDYPLAVAEIQGLLVD